MSYFKLELLNIHSDTTGSTDQLKVLPSVISEYYNEHDFSAAQMDYQGSRTAAQQSETGYFIKDETKSTASWSNTVPHTFCYTYDEKFKSSKNAQKELTFCMDRYITRDDHIEENPFIKNIIVGSQLLLTDKDNREHLFTVTKIDFDFSNANLKYSYACSDSFTYQLSRQKDGYEIENDSTSEDFIGAHNVDWWVRAKIQPDCNITYEYLTLEEGLFKTTTNEIHSYNYDTTNIGTNIDYIIKRPLTKTLANLINTDIQTTSEYYQDISFSGSGTANSILISLGEQLGLVLDTYEYLDRTSYQLKRYYWFMPEEDDAVSGLYCSPYSDIQSFSLSHDGTSLSSILNVTGGEIDEELITLIPSVPSFFKIWFESQDWKDTKNSYVPGMFTRKCQYERYQISSKDTNKITIDTTITSLSSLYSGNKINVINNYLYIPMVVFGTVFNISTLYDYIRFNSNYTYSYINIGGNQYTTTTKNWQFIIMKTNDNNEYFINPNEEQSISNALIYNENNTLIDYNMAFIKMPWNSQTTLENLTDYSLYVDFYRKPSEEELEFAEIADACPWLENKLIDFSYFYNHSILNKSEYNKLIQLVTNDLRMANSQLLLYSDQYYAALHKKTQYIADLTNSLDNLGASFSADVLTSYKSLGTVTEAADFSTQYDAIFNSKTIEPIKLLNYDTLLSDYVNKYINAEQSFLKNCYNFRKYWETQNSFISSGQTLYNSTFTLSGTNLQWTDEDGYEYTVGFDKPNLVSITSAFNLFNEDTGTPVIDIYKINNTLDTVITPEQFLSKSQYDADPTRYYTLNTTADENGYTLITNDYYHNDTTYYEYGYEIDDEHEEYVELLEIIDEYGPIVNLYEDLNDHYRFWTAELNSSNDNIIIRNKYHYNRSDEDWWNEEGKTLQWEEDYQIEITFVPDDLQIFQIDSEAAKFNLLANYYINNENTTYCNNLYMRYNDNRYYRINSNAENCLSTQHGSDFNPTINTKWDKWSELDSNFKPYVDAGLLSSFVNNYDSTVSATIKENNKVKSYMVFFNETNIYFKGKQFTTQYNQTTGQNTFTETGTNQYFSSTLINYYNYGDFYRYVWGYASAGDVIGQIGLGLGSAALVSTLGFAGGPIGWIGAAVMLGLVALSQIQETPYNQRVSNNGDTWVSLIDAAGINKNTVSFNKYDIDFYTHWNEEDIARTDYWINTAENAVYFQDYRKTGNISSITKDSYLKYGQFVRPYYLSIVDGTADSGITYGNKYYYQTDFYRLIDSITEKINTTDTYYAIPLNLYSNTYWPLRITADNNFLNNFADEKYIINQKTYYRWSKVKKYYLANYIIPLTFKSSIDSTTKQVNYTKSIEQALIDSAADENLTVTVSVTNNCFVLTENGTVKGRYLILHEEKYTPLFIGQLPYSTSVVEYTTLTEWDDLKQTFYGKDLYYVDTDYKFNIKYPNQALSSTENLMIGFYTKNDPINNPQYIQESADSTYNKYQIYYTREELEDGYNYIKQHTIGEIINGDYYYLSNATYTTYHLTDTIENVPLTCYRRKKESNQYVAYEKYNNTTYNTISKIDNQWQITDFVYNGTSKTLNLTRTGSNPTLINQYNNGTFWYAYHNSTNIPILQEQAAYIETELEQYWNQAYNASLLCRYFLPEHWQQSYGQETNVFFNELFDCSLYKSSSSYIYNLHVKDNYIPQIDIYNNHNNHKYYYKFFMNEDKARAAMTYNNIRSIEYNTYNNIESIKEEDVKYNGSTISDIFNYLGLNTVGSWKGIVRYTDVKYYKSISGGTTWNETLRKMSQNRLSKEKFGGWYEMAINLLKDSNKFTIQTTEMYDEAKRQQDKIWKTIYSLYPNVILETSYENTDAINSTILYNMAKIVFNQYKQPERNYNITTIDTAHLKGYQGQRLYIGMPIAINAEEFYDNFDDIKTSLQQYLFISDISYSLRSDADIELTVNSIKYSDKVIKQLVRLIR